MADTVTVRGAAGAVWEQDLSLLTANARTQWDKDIADGRLTVIDGEPAQELGEGSDNGEKSAESDPSPAQASIPDDVARTVDGLAGWVAMADTPAEQSSRAAAVLAVEQAEDNPRVTLVGHLKKLLNIGDDDTNPATPATPEA